MTASDLARQNAISFECKKDSLRQNQTGDWKIAFTVQGLDMDERLTKAFPGTRYQAVLVEIGDDELPVTALKPHAQNHLKEASQDEPVPEKPRMEWRELQPAAQAGIRCEDPVFWKFLDEEYCEFYRRNDGDAAATVRFICCVNSRSQLGTKQAARVLWHQLDEHFQAWKLAERVGA